MLPGGEVRWMRWNGRVDFREGPSGQTLSMMFGACVDITELKRTEMALRESEKLFRATFETAAVGVAHVATDGSWLLVNRRLGETLAIKLRSLLTKNSETLPIPITSRPIWCSSDACSVMKPTATALKSATCVKMARSFGRD